jgi:hypothetical protein
MARCHVGNACSADIGQTRWCSGRGAEIHEGDILSNGTENKRKLTPSIRDRAVARLVCSPGVEATGHGSRLLERMIFPLGTVVSI